MSNEQTNSRYSYTVGVSSFFLFILPVGLFLYRFGGDVPFYFMAEDAFYYLSITARSGHVPFFSFDGIHPTNGFHPLWEWTIYGLSKLTFFRLDGRNVLPRLFGFNLAIVAAAVAMFSAYTYRVTRRPWLALVSFCPGLLWILVGIGSPAYMTAWSAVNGMETGLELLFLSIALMLLGRDFRGSIQNTLGIVALGLVVLSRLDDVFLLAAVMWVFLTRASKLERGRRLLPFTVPILMICGYLFYNHHTVGVWLPVSGMAKVGRGFVENTRAISHLVSGWSFFTLPVDDVAFSFGNQYVMLVQMLAPMLIAIGWLLWKQQTKYQTDDVLRALAIGVVLKGAYNFIRVPVGYQGAWYYGASIAISNILLASYLGSLFDARNEFNALRTRQRLGFAPAVFVAARYAALLCFSFVSFNTVSSRTIANGYKAKRDAWQVREEVTQALARSTSAPFLELQDGELSFMTGHPAMSGFGLATDPEAIRAQHEGTYFRLLADRGITIAAASNTYPAALKQSSVSKAVFPYWGFNREEVKYYCFQPFWHEPQGNVVLYRIIHKPTCASNLSLEGTTR